MEADTYYIASLKLGAWMSKTGQYTSVLADAREFGRMEALIMVKKQKNGGNVVIPVRKEDMEWAG